MTHMRQFHKHVYEVLDILKDLGVPLDVNNGAYLAGGCLATDDMPRDFDLLFSSMEAQVATRLLLAGKCDDIKIGRANEPNNLSTSVAEHTERFWLAAPGGGRRVVELLLDCPAPAHLWVPLFDLTIAQIATDGRDCVGTLDQKESYERCLFWNAYPTPSYRVQKYEKRSIGGRPLWFDKERAARRLPNGTDRREEARAVVAALVALRAP